jgi:hypothetical protein
VIVLTALDMLLGAFAAVYLLLLTVLHLSGS